MRMCAGEFGPKLHVTSILSKAQIPNKEQASPRAKNGPFDSHTRGGEAVHAQDTSSIQGDPLSTNHTQAQRSMGPPEGVNRLKTGRATHN